MRRKVANARIDMRITSQHKYFFELAAFIGGYDSLSNFIEEASEILAKKVFETAEESRELSANDRDLLLKFLEKAPEPNETLKAAYKKVLNMYNLEENGNAIYNIDSSLVKKPDEGNKTKGHA